jgi:hypothetical protein
MIVLKMKKTIFLNKTNITSHLLEIIVCSFFLKTIYGKAIQIKVIIGFKKNLMKNMLDQKNKFDDCETVSLKEASETIQF